MVSLLPEFGGATSPATVIAALLEQALDEDARAQSWDAFGAFADEADEDDLAEPILRAIAQGAAGDEAIWQAALKLLAVLWVRCGRSPARRIARNIADAGAQDVRSLAFFRH